MTMGNIAPFFTNYGPAGSSSPGYVTTGTQTFTGNKTIAGSLTVTTPAVVGVETLATFGLTEDTGSSLSIINNTGSNNIFAPAFLAVQSGTSAALGLNARGGTDSGTSPLVQFDARIGASTSVATRPLMTFRNNGATVFTLDASGSVGLGTSPGTKLDVSGSARFSGVVSAGITGAGVEIDYGGAAAGTGRIMAFDRSGATERPMVLRGSNVDIQTNSTSRLTIGTTKAAVSYPLQFASFTVATLPAATVGAGCTVYVSDATGGAVLAFSNGTNWLRCDTSAIVT